MRLSPYDPVTLSPENNPKESIVAKEKAPRITIPFGKAHYPRLRHPDTKYNEHGDYKADVLVELEAAKPVMAKLSKVFKDHTGKAPNKLDNTMWTVETDDEGDKTGFVLFKCRAKNKLVKKTGEVWDRKPKLFDAKLRPLPSKINPWGGSVMAVNAEIYCWETADKKQGVSLQPIAVQIKELVQGEGNEVDPTEAFEETEGFEVEEDQDDDTSGFETEDGESGDDDEDDDADF